MHARIAQKSVHKTFPGRKSPHTPLWPSWMGIHTNSTFRNTSHHKTALSTPHKERTHTHTRVTHKTQTLAHIYIEHTNTHASHTFSQIGPIDTNIHIWRKSMYAHHIRQTLTRPAALLCAHTSVDVCVRVRVRVAPAPTSVRKKFKGCANIIHIHQR